MSQSTVILGLSVAYLGLLFVVAYVGERRAASWSLGKAAPVIYALSLAIYCTSWTFYGAVGRAATVGLDFMLIYVGPALVMLIGWPALAKIIRLAKRHNVTSIADFLAARYGKSRAVAVTVTLIATIGVLPYIALQLQAVSTTFAALAGPISIEPTSGTPVLYDTAFIVALLMAVFTILFGVRHVQASEQHRGMMLAIAFESLVKVIALLAVGPFVIWGMFDGPADLSAAIDRIPDVDHLISFFPTANWAVITMLAGLAFLCLPRQFHVAVVEARPSQQPAHGALAIPALHAADQHFRGADRPGRPRAAAGGQRPGLVRAQPPNVRRRRMALGLRLHRRPVGGDQHGGGGLHGALRDGRQRAGDALAAAQPGRGRRQRRPPRTAGAPSFRRRHPAGRLCLSPHHRRPAAARHHRHGVVLRGGEFRPGLAARPVLAAHPPLRCHRRPGGRLRAVVLLHPVADNA